MSSGDPSKAWSFLTSKKLVDKRKKVDWSGINLNHQYYNYLVCGDYHKHYLQYFIDKFISRPVSILSLGCGNGNLERVLAGFNIPYTSILGMDINPDLTRFAGEEAQRLKYKNLNYLAADLNHISFSDQKYGLIIFFHSLHHVENLEGVLESVSRALEPDGLLLVVDFVGPTRFQWTDKQIRLTQELLDLLPPALKIDLRNPKPKELKSQIIRPKAEEVAGADISEAVRSSEIYAMLKERFLVLEEKPMGGTLLLLLFEGIAGNFDEKDPLVCSLIKALQKIEEQLILSKVIESNFVFMVLKNFSDRE